MKQKKKLAVLLMAAMVASLVACGSQGGSTGGTSQESSQESVQESTQESASGSGQETEAQQPSSEESAQQPGNSEGTMGAILLQDFQARAAAGETDDLQALADNLRSNSVIEFMSGAMPVTPGWLAGFSKEIDGFKSGVQFGPMMGSIAFVGYVFELEDAADASAFMQTLKDNADPRWQICVEANETVVDAYENYVFFVMCPGPDEM